MTATTTTGGRRHPALGLMPTAGRHLEPALVIEHREALVFLLYQAAEIEHGSMCQYLYSAFSLRRHDDPDLTDDQRASIDRWRRAVNSVAAEEMLHLALVSNLLSALGAAPNLSRPPLPHPARHYPPGVHLALIPFGEQALRHFLYLERPEGLELQDTINDDEALSTALSHAQPVMSERDIVPRAQQFETIGHLYRAIERGLEHLCDKLGEPAVFVGPPKAQAGAADFRWKGLKAVTDLASAKAALELIVDQGEGARGDWRTAHFGRFYQTLREYLETRAADPDFEPTRPVLVADVRPGEYGEVGDLIGDHGTADVVDLFNVVYEVMLQVLARYFTHTHETSDQLTVLAEVALALMVEVMRPLGELIPDLPVGPAHPGRTAGASFELFYTSGYHLPHQHAAWRLLQERLRLAAHLAGQIDVPAAAGVLADCAHLLDNLADRLALVSDESAAAKSNRTEAHVRITANGPYVVSGSLPLSEVAIGTDGDGNSTHWSPLQEFETPVRYALCRCGQSSNKPFCDGTHAHVGFDGTETASRKTYAEDAAALDGPSMELSDDRPLCAMGRFCDSHGTIWQLINETDTPAGRELVAMQAQLCPSGRLVVRDKQTGQVLEPELEPSVAVIEDPEQHCSGPIWVRGGVMLESADGFVYEARNRVTLCRCGQSSNKPFCDATHARIGFQAHPAPAAAPSPAG